VAEEVREGGGVKAFQIHLKTPLLIKNDVWGAWDTDIQAMSQDELREMFMEDYLAWMEEGAGELGNIIERVEIVDVD
jgi:hypothetical protein